MKTIRTITALATTAAAVAVTATSASAGVPTGDFAPFRYCPYNDTTLTQCVYSDTSSGSIKLGNQNVPINKHLILQGGLRVIDGDNTTFVDAVGADTLVKTKLDVPGGLVGIVSDNWFFGPLLDAFYWAVSSVNGVTATAEKVGPVQFNLGNILTGSGTGVQLPVRVHLENPFLGNDCYIGSAGSPVTFKLTTGSTAPPNSITGNPGTLSFNNDFTVSTVSGLSLVDNKFTAPKATGCGNTFIDRPLVTFALNAKIGLNAASGVSSAVLNGASKLAGAADVKASAGS